MNGDGCVNNYFAFLVLVRPGDLGGLARKSDSLAREFQYSSQILSYIIQRFSDFVFWFFIGIAQGHDNVHLCG
jgi:hypothetical protein